MPLRLFRFLPKSAKTFLDEKKLWFSNILDFNDPFDATPSLKEIIDQDYETVIRKFSQGQPLSDEFRHTLKRDQDQTVMLMTRFLQEQYAKWFGVVCFTGKNDLIPMWAHYASNHEGFALEFDPTHPLFSRGDFGSVTYSPKRPELLSMSNRSPTEFIKSTDWDREDEWRINKAWSSLKTEIKPWDKKSGRYLDLPPDAIRAVYFGCRATADLTTQIEQSCKRFEYRDVKLFQMIPDAGDYKLNPIPWDGHKPVIPESERPTLEALWQIFSAGHNVP